MNFAEYYSVDEMAAPRQLDIAKLYYHGTFSELSFKSIISSGLIKPGQIIKPRRDKMQPVKGKAYITPDLKYAIIYALNGDLAGTHYYLKLQKDKAFGYLFVIDGTELKDIQPDEDSIGEFVYSAFLGKFGDKFNWLKRLAENYLTTKQLKNVKSGEYADWAVAGRKLVRNMRDDEKLRLIDAGSHIAHDGEVHFSQAWKFDLSRTAELQKDSSNFFDIATRVI